MILMALSYLIGAPKPASIFGVVTDAQTNIPLAGADVLLTVYPAAFQNVLTVGMEGFGGGWSTALERPDRTQSNFNGEFRFLNLPDGNYTLSVTLPGTATRYGTGTATAAVASPSPTIANLTLPPTAVVGTVQGKVGSTTAPVTLAFVSFLHSDENTYSDINGAYLFNAVEAGPRSLIVSAQGFPTQTIATTLQQGITTTINAVLGT
jgi:Carboxypeptidase regulatory-like domain